MKQELLQKKNVFVVFCIKDKEIEHPAVPPRTGRLAIPAAFQQF